MPKDELYEQATVGRTTRRTIVKTGVKLAYAAPLVAATTKLTSGGVVAVSGPTCAPVGAPCTFPRPDLCCSLACGSGEFFDCPTDAPCCIDFSVGQAAVIGASDETIVTFAE